MRLLCHDCAYEAGFSTEWWVLPFKECECAGCGRIRVVVDVDYEQDWVEF